jgi:hypothetical protein
MIQYKEIKRTKICKEFDFAQCDKCGKTEKDPMELQEWYTIHFIGGYNSIFGDGDEYECDICQQCLKKMVGNELRYLGSRI